MEAISVLIVDDHPVVRDGLRSMLGVSPGIAVVDEASTGLEALEKVRTLRPRVVLMDIRMADMDGIEATRRIKHHLPETCVVIMTMHDEEGYVLEAVQAGAAGYLLKDAPREDVCRTIQAAANGDITIKATLLQKALRAAQAATKGRSHEVGGSGGRPVEELTPRERSVLRLLVKGATNREIGDALFISEETAKKHVQSIAAKLGASDRTSAAVMAVRLGLVE